MKFRILILDNTHRIFTETLSAAGIVCDCYPAYTRKDVLKHIRNYDGIVVRSNIYIDREVIDAGIHLKCIARIGAGMDAIDVEYAQNSGIACLNSPEGNRDAVAEHAMGMLLSLFNNLCRANEEVRHGFWNREGNRGLEIKGKTIGIIGYGNMGSAFAKRLSGFECRIIAYDKYKTDYGDEYAESATLETIYAESDILSLHVPLTAETTQMVDLLFLQQFKKNIYLLNTARGKVVCTKSLSQAMQTGKVLGACLDVLEYEAFTSEWNSETITPELRYLLESQKVVFSPHVAGWTQESKYKLPFYLAKKIVDVLQPSF